MNEFSNGFGAVSVEELEQVEGGLGFLLGAAAVGVGFCVGYTVTSLILKAID